MLRLNVFGLRKIQYKKNRWAPKSRRHSETWVSAGAWGRPWAQPPPRHIPLLLRGLLSTTCLYTHSKNGAYITFTSALSRGTWGTYADPRSVSKSNHTAGENYVQWGPSELLGRLSFQWTSECFRVNFVMQAAPCLVAESPAVLLSPLNTWRDMSGIPDRETVLDQRLQCRALINSYFFRHLC